MKSESWGIRRVIVGMLLLVTLGMLTSRAATTLPPKPAEVTVADDYQFRITAVNDAVLAFIDAKYGKITRVPVTAIPAMPLTEADMAKLATLPWLTSVDLSYTPKGIDLSPLKAMPTLRKLVVKQEKVPDMKTIGACPNLKELEIQDSEKMTDISFLKLLPNLETLNLPDARAITDFSPLGSLTNLQSLSLESCEAGRSFEAISKLTKLTSIQMNSVNIASLDFLAPCKKLKSLTITRARSLKDISAIGGCVDLEYLVLSDAPVNDISCVKNFPKLKWLHLDKTLVHDLSPAAGLTNLDSVSLDDTSALTDLSPLAKVPKLTSLDLNRSAATDLAPLANHPSLQSLEIANTKVTNLKPLAKLPRLYTLDCAGTPVTDISVLASVPKLSSIRLPYGLPDASIAALKTAKPDASIDIARAPQN